jgi:hypothetical protein
MIWPPQDSTPWGGFLLGQPVNPKFIPGLGVLVLKGRLTPTFFVGHVFPGWVKIWQLMKFCDFIGEVQVFIFLFSYHGPAF